MTSTIMPEQSEVVLGVDSHRDEHVAAVLSRLGAVLGTAAFPTTTVGYQELLAWACSFGVLRQAGVECTGSYGAALSRFLQSIGVAVIEVNQTDRADRRKRGKTDTLDAEAAARAVISGRATTIAKTGDGLVEAIRVMVRRWPSRNTGMAATDHRNDPEPILDNDVGPIDSHVW